MRLFPVVLVCALLLSSCGSDGNLEGATTTVSSATGDLSQPTASAESTDQLDTTGSIESEASPATTEPAAAEPPETTVPGDSSTPVVVSDAELGLVYDLGQIMATNESSGVTVIEFDRFQGYDLDGTLVSAPMLLEEPIYEPSTDWPFVNENPKLRSYPLATVVEILETDPIWMAGLEDWCSGGNGSTVGTPIQWTPTSLTTNGPVAALTFNEEGEVVRIRYMTSC